MNSRRSGHWPFIQQCACVLGDKIRKSKGWCRLYCPYCSGTLSCSNYFLLTYCFVSIGQLPQEQFQLRPFIIDSLYAATAAPIICKNFACGVVKFTLIHFKNSVLAGRQSRCNNPRAHNEHNHWYSPHPRNKTENFAFQPERQSGNTGSFSVSLKGVDSQKILFLVWYFECRGVGIGSSLWHNRIFS